MPLAAHAADITRLGQNYRLNLHVGLIDPDDLAALALPVDVISFDLVGDAATARAVYGLDVSLETYIAHLKALQRIAPVVPHITIGLHAGKIRGEYAAIDALQALVTGSTGLHRAHPDSTAHHTPTARRPTWTRSPA